MLFIVGTPIGNLGDITLRAAQTILEADVLLAEDTRSAGMLRKHCEEILGSKRNSEQLLFSFHKENELERVQEVLGFLREGKNVALVSQAGMPLIADPGLLLIRAVQKEEFPYTVIPGPTSATAALVLSGFNPLASVFVGFLPKEKSKIVKLFKKYQAVRTTLEEPLTLIAFESPFRVEQTLAICMQEADGAQIFVARELTKMHESMYKGTPEELLRMGLPKKGEYVLVIELR